MDEGVSNFSLRWRTSMEAKQLESVGIDARTKAAEEGERRALTATAP
ncbi:uncharacterized protein G2W53_025744 [Senna tora]|uniref:Uncharacterized protein n=1 Tax=Senna tora TaxID=362788 RepID=A0A834TMT2_9FABA|nr:uncharacterized protein G2W53_025744 [Senna tora]